LLHLSACIASKHNKGGQSAPRFARTRDGEKLAFLRKVAEKSSKLLQDSRGFVVGGKAGMKRKLLDQLPPSFRACVVHIVDLDCDADDVGLQRAAAHVPEVADMVGRSSAQKVVSTFLELAARTDAAASMCCYGENETAAAVKIGAVSQVLVASTRCRQGRTLQDWYELSAPYGTVVVEVQQQSEQEVYFGQFGVGGLLRWPVDKDVLDVNSELPTSEFLLIEQAPRMLRAADEDKVHSNTDTTADTSRDEPRILTWLRSALQYSTDAEALVACAAVMLHDESSSLEERVVQTVELLRAEGVQEGVLIELAYRAYEAGCEQ